MTSANKSKWRSSAEVTTDDLALADEVVSDIAAGLCLLEVELDGAYAAFMAFNEAYSK